MPEFKSGIHLEKAVGQTYTISIPHRMALGECVPLILLLHWDGRKFRWMGRGILEDLGLPSLSGMQAAIVAADRKRRHWAKPKAAEDIAKLVNYLDEHYNLDPQRRVVVGFSLGGVGVWYLMLERPDLFPCGVALAAPVPNHIKGTDLKAPVYAIHSELDEHFPFAQNQENAQKIIDEGAPLEFHSIPLAAHANVRDFIHSLTESTAWMESVWDKNS